MDEIIHISNKQLEQLRLIVANYDKTPGELLTGEQLRSLSYALTGIEHEPRCPMCED